VPGLRRRRGQAYLSITARAEVQHGHAQATEIWKSTDDMWWSGPDDPNVCVLRVRPVTAELWDGPSSAAMAAGQFNLPTEIVSMRPVEHQPEGAVTAIT